MSVRLLVTGRPLQDSRRGGQGSKGIVPPPPRGLGPGRRSGRVDSARPAPPFQESRPSPRFPVMLFHARAIFRGRCDEMFRIVDKVLAACPQLALLMSPLLKEQDAVQRTVRSVVRGGPARWRRRALEGGPDGHLCQAGGQLLPVRPLV